MYYIYNLYPNACSQGSHAVGLWFFGCGGLADGGGFQLKVVVEVICACIGTPARGELAVASFVLALVLIDLHFLVSTARQLI